MASHSTYVAVEHSPADTRAVFAAEHSHIGASCDFPGCDNGAARGARMCDYHALVRVASNGSWVDDHHPEGGHG